MLTLLLVCMTAIMVIACQVHTSGSAHEHAIPSSHPGSHNASRQSAGVMPCMIAVLPGVALCIIFTYFWFPLTLVTWHYVTLVFLPFIPPRHTTCALLASWR
jgi:hypothetical protein